MTADYDHPTKLAPIEAWVASIESVLVEKGVLDTDALDPLTTPAALDAAAPAERAPL
jgi:hypothetical protein